MRIDTWRQIFDSLGNGFLTICGKTTGTCVKITNILEGTVTNTLGAKGAGVVTTFTVAVPGVTVGKGYVLGVEGNDNTQITPDKTRVEARITGSDQVTVSVENITGGSITYPAITWRVACLLQA